MSDDPGLTTVCHRLTEARDSLGGEHMTTPASEIIARGRKRRARGRLTATGFAAAAIAAVVAVTTLAPGNSARPGAEHAQLAAWTVRTNPNGTVTFTLRNLLHPASLQHELAKAGVPAFIRSGEICQSTGPYISTDNFLKSKPAGFNAFFALMGGSTGTGPLGWSFTITPSKIPSGDQFVISAVSHRVPPYDMQATYEFTTANSPIKCGQFVKP
jgi:hypothetical protein